MDTKNNIQKSIEQLTMTVNELYDKLLFSGARSYYESVTQQEISENELIEVIKKQRPVKQTWQNGKAYCGACGKRIPGKIKAHYCHKCGQKVDWT